MASSKPAIPEPSEIAGRYVVEKKLGAGAFGTVYKAKDKILGRSVAIKTIRLESLAAQGGGLEEMLQRFTREARVSATLKHPNIVTVHDLGNADGLTYLAMEFIDGVGLEKVIAQGPLSVERAASLGAQVADALDFAHKNGVVHRDIKPANIMVEAGDRVKVADFGIAKAADSGEHLTMTGSVLGTPSYMSPEQARGGDIDGRSDLFSVGCVLYEMLTGKKAFGGVNFTAIIFEIITKEPRPLRELAKDVPEALANLVQKAIHKAPDSRFQSGRELADALLAFARPGSAPTLRQYETPTVPAGTMAVIPTVVIPPTLAESPTQATVPTQVARPSPPPLPSPPRPAVTPPRPLVGASARPPAPAARKSGGGAGLMVGIGVVGLGVLAMVVFGGWYLFLRKPAGQAPSITETVATAPASTMSPPSSLAATETPPPVLAPTPPPATIAPETLPPRGVASRETPTPRPTMAAEGRPARVRPDAPPPAADDDAVPAGSFLDQEPAPSDGTDAAARLAEGYRSGGNPSNSRFGASGRFQRRELSPRPMMPAEMPAIAVLRHVMNAQGLFNKRNGRYGSISELSAAQSLPLDVPATGNTFERKGYRFELETTGDGFKIIALPQTTGPRPFIGDDSGYIRAGLE